MFGRRLSGRPSRVVRDVVSRGVRLFLEARDSSARGESGRSTGLASGTRGLCKLVLSLCAVVAFSGAACVTAAEPELVADAASSAKGVSDKAQRPLPSPLPEGEGGKSAKPPKGRPTGVWEKERVASISCTLQDLVNQSFPSTKCCFC